MWKYEQTILHLLVGLPMKQQDSIQGLQSCVGPVLVPDQTGIYRRYLRTNTRYADMYRHFVGGRRGGEEEGIWREKRRWCRKKKGGMPERDGWCVGTKQCMEDWQWQACRREEGIGLEREEIARPKIIFLF